MDLVLEARESIVKTLKEELSNHSGLDADQIEKILSNKSLLAKVYAELNALYVNGQYIND